MGQQSSRPPPPTAQRFAESLLRGVWSVVKTVGGFVFREAAVYLIASKILDVLVNQNPNLGAVQRERLNEMILNALRQFNKQDIERSLSALRGIIALASPESDSAQLLDGFVTMLFSAAQEGGHADAGLSPEQRERANRVVQWNERVPWEVESFDKKEAERATQILQGRYHIAPEVVQSTAPSLLPAIVRALQPEEEGGPAPVCGITLDDVVEENGTIAPDVVMLVQSLPPENADSGNPRPAAVHLFPYKGEALNEWFDSSGAHTNPMTRQVISDRQLIRLSYPVGQGPAVVGESSTGANVNNGPTFGAGAMPSAPAAESIPEEPLPRRAETHAYGQGYRIRPADTSTLSGWWSWLWGTDAETHDRPHGRQARADALAQRTPPNEEKEGPSPSAPPL